MSKPPPLLVVGTTPFSAEIADVASAAGYELAGFVEIADRSRAGRLFAGLPVHWIDDLASLVETHVALCGIDASDRGDVVDRVAARGLRFATVAHPTAAVSATSHLGEGTVVGAGAVVTSYTSIGCHVLIGHGCLIGHHTDIADYVSLEPGAKVAGSCRIGAGVRIGTAAVIIDHVTVGARSVVGTNAVVVKDIAPNITVAGIPARVVEVGLAGEGGGTATV